MMHVAKSQQAHQQTANASCYHSELIPIAFLFSLALCCLDANLLVILLKSSKVFTGLTELTFLHSFSHVPVHECTLAVHEVEFVINAGEDFCNCSGIADHAAGTHDFCQVTTGYDSWWLIIDSALETCR